MSYKNAIIEFKDIKQHKGRVVFNEIEKTLIDEEIIEIFQKELDYFESHNALYHKNINNDISEVWQISNKIEAEPGNKDVLRFSLYSDFYELKIERYTKKSTYEKESKTNIDITFKKESNENKKILIKEEKTIYDGFISPKADKHIMTIINKKLDSKNDETSYTMTKVEDQILFSNKKCSTITVNNYYNENNRYVVCNLRNFNDVIYFIKKEDKNLKVAKAKEQIEEAMEYHISKNPSNWIIINESKFSYAINSNYSISEVYEAEVQNRILSKKLN